MSFKINTSCLEPQPKSSKFSKKKKRGKVEQVTAVPIAQ